MAKRLGSQLFVSRLSFYTTNQDLKNWFSPFGLVTEARLVMDNKTQRPKGFGFVSFQSVVEAQNALKAMNGRLLKLKVGAVIIATSGDLVPNKTKIMKGRLVFVEVAKTTLPGEDARPVEDVPFQK